MPNAISELAAFCGSIETVAETTLKAARRTVLDTIGVAASGAATPGGRASFEAASAIWGAGASSIWFSRTLLTPAGATFVNATYAASLDLDDGHRAAAGHPAAAVVPAVLALVGRHAVSGRRLLTAIAVGYEVAVRAAASRGINSLRTTDTGLWCGYGAAAAAGWLMALPLPVIAHAMAIAGQTATGQFATGWTRVGHTVKEGIPWAAANGIQAAYLAAAGHRGPLDLLDEEPAYNRTRLLAGLGDTWAVEHAYFKRYSCCRWAHAAIDAAVLLLDERKLSAGAIEGIVVEIFDRALTLPNQIIPTSNEAAQYSIPFCIAVALLHGQTALLPLEDRHLADPDVIALASRVRLEASPRYVGAFPATTPATVAISAGGEVFALEITYPKGEPGNPMSDAELVEKFATLTSRLPMSSLQVRSISDAVTALMDGTATTSLLDALCNAS